MPSLPPYHWSTHLWHPRSDRQHLDAITGGFIRVWQILHMNAVSIVAAIPTGSLASLVTENKVSRRLLIVPKISSMSSNRVLAAADGSLLSSSSPIRLFFGAAACTADIVRAATCSIANTFRLGAFQKLKPMNYNEIKNTYKAYLYTHTCCASTLFDLEAVR